MPYWDHKRAARKLSRPFFCLPFRRKASFKYSYSHNEKIACAARIDLLRAWDCRDFCAGTSHDTISIVGFVAVSEKFKKAVRLADESSTTWTLHQGFYA